MIAATAEEHYFTSPPSAFLSHGISRELQIAEKSGTDVFQLECLCKEYDTTFRIWIDRPLNARRNNSAQIYSSGYRASLLYLIEVAASLEAGETQIYSLLLKRRS